MTIGLTRRGLIGAIGAGGGLLLSGCDRINANPGVRKLLAAGNDLTFRAQRLVTDRAALATEYGAADMSPVFRTNGNTLPSSLAYQAHAAAGFADWRLTVDGLVEQPLALPLTRIRALPHRT
ncbi:MAG TPA: molybdopterin-binding protein, partial [Sphingomonas sp.]|nr:molybdopterin-binding protein [Sphingomonas sp.]